MRCSSGLSVSSPSFSDAVRVLTVAVPETAKRPLEEMNVLFTSTSWFVPTMDHSAFAQHDLERRVEEVREKKSVVATSEQVE